MAKSINGLILLLLLPALLFLCSGAGAEPVGKAFGGNYQGGESGWTTYKMGTDIVPAADDTSDTFSLRRKDGGYYTAIDYAFKIVALYPASANDDIAGNLVLQLKYLGLFSDSIFWPNAVGRYRWVDYDSSISMSGLTDSVTVFDTTGLRHVAAVQHQNHILLPPADSARWILRTAAAADSIDYWAVIQNLSGNSKSYYDCLEGSWTQKGLSAAADDTTYIPTYIPGIDRGQSYSKIAGWLYMITDTTAASDSIAAGTLTIVPGLKGTNYYHGGTTGDSLVSIDSLMLYNAYSNLTYCSHATAIAAAEDRVQVPFCLPIPALADKLELIHATGANTDSLYWYQLDYRLLK